jgi:hypothetical protein
MHPLISRVARRSSVVTAILLAYAGAGFVQVVAAANQTVVQVSDSFSFSVEIPAGWSRFAPSSGDGTLLLIDFPPDKAVHATFLPSDGSRIAIVPIEAFHREPALRSLEEFMASDLKHDTVVDSRRKQIAGTAGTLTGTEVQISSNDDLRGIIYYFYLEGHPIKAQLLYLDGNQHVEALIRARDEILMKLRPVRKTHGKQ